MTLLLSNDDVRDLVTMPDCIAALEDAYIEISGDRAIAGSRADMVTTTEHPDSVYQLKAMGATLANAGVSSIRLNSDILSWPKVRGKARRQKVPLAPGKRWTGLVLLFSTRTGEPLAIFPDGVMQSMRVAATIALGVKYLARQDARTVGLIGTGWQARSQVLAVTEIRDIGRIRCYSPTKANRESFCKEMASLTGIEMIPAASAREAVRRADVLLCATNSMENVFFKDWIEPGMHFSTIRDGDVEPAAIMSADVVFMHDPTGLSTAHFHTTHGLRIPDQMEQAATSPELSYLNRLPILQDLIGGKVKGRSADGQVTCFLNFRGLAFQFTAVGAVLYQKASAMGRGRDLPTEWFTEDVHP